MSIGQTKTLESVGLQGFLFRYGGLCLWASAGLSLRLTTCRYNN